MITMTDKEKAEMILEGLDEYLQVNWHMKEFYIKGILKGLKKIREAEEVAAETAGSVAADP